MVFKVVILINGLVKKCMHLISIVVPVYNVRKYIKQCLDSIIIQDYSNFEIILVDDGSNDGSEVICDEYARKFKNVQVFHLENAGVSNARNVGMSHCLGEWVFFVDADDWITPNALSVLYSQITSDTDLVVGTCIKAYTDHFEDDTSNDVQYADFEVSERFLDLLSSCILNVSSSNKLFPQDMRSGPQLTYPVLKLYKKKIIDKFGLHFSTSLSLGEDKLFNIQYIKSCSGIVKFINERVYFYRMRKSSASYSINDRMKKMSSYYSAISNEIYNSGISGLYKFLDINIVQMFWKQLQNTSHVLKISKLWDYTCKLRKSDEYVFVLKCIKNVNIQSYSNRKARLIVFLLKCKCFFVLILIFKLLGNKSVKFLYE